MTYRSSKAVSTFAPKKPQHVFFHVFAQTTHVLTAPHGFACVGIPATWLYIPSFIEIRSGVSEPQGVKIWPFPLLWLVAFTTACTTVHPWQNWNHWNIWTLWQLITNEVMLCHFIFFSSSLNTCELVALCMFYSERLIFEMSFLCWVGCWRLFTHYIIDC